MSITYSRIKKFSSFDLLHAHFIHPKLIIIEDSHKVRILDVTVRNEEHAENDWLFSFETKISSTLLHQRLLWILLKSGEITVINTVSGSQIKIACEKLVNYKIQKLRSQNNNVVVISKSGECLLALYSIKELEQDIVDGKPEHTIAVEKSCSTSSAVESHLLTNGLNAYTEGEALALKCPITGLCEVLYSDKKILHVVPWGDSPIISDGATMWVVDITDSQILFEFREDGETTYYPLGAYNNDFYYLLWDQNQVRILSIYLKTSSCNFVFLILIGSDFNICY